MTERTGTELSPVRLQELLLEYPALDDFLAGLANELSDQLADLDVTGASFTVVRPRRQMLHAGSHPGFPSAGTGQHGAGPASGVLATGLPVVVRHLDGESRRPETLTVSPGEDVAAFASVPVPVQVPFAGPCGAVFTVYSDRPGAFGPEAVRSVERAAAESATMLALALRLDAQTHRADNLQAALESRTVVDLAAGIIMAQNNCSQQSAVDILRSVSNSRNVKVRDVAAGVVAVVSDRVSTHFEE
ncbi:GAF and ANTAR domain-containing protein [Arthrobacter gengyunqii]|uniref:ANTAR domain-containing protein n=1 Tax=Arthrobacter gengyunqii TaxID=2886940 RepID=A0ABS8GL22_9MICC|nr:ANTAR domain-containing protein [Arthrobacter gengyunqii]